MFLKLFFLSKFSRIFRLLGFFILPSLVFGYFSSVMAQEPLRVGLSQITSHPSLDKVRAGILDALKAQGYGEDRLRISFENAQGNIAHTVQIAQKLVAKGPHAVVAVGTPSAQALLKLTRPRGIPLVFASISDPVGAGLVESLELPGPYATGTRNAPCFKALLECMRDVLGSVERLGIILNPSEKNALDLLALFKAEAAPLGIHIQEASAASTLEVLPAAQKLATTVQAFFLLQDNTVASALPSVLKVAKAHCLPVFASFPEAVESGALLALAPDEYAIGQQTGRLLLEILNGAQPQCLPVEDPACMGLYLNLGTAKSLQIKLADDLIQKAKAIYP